MLFLPCSILLDFSIFFQIFCPGLQYKQNKNDKNNNGNDDGDKW